MQQEIADRDVWLDGLEIGTANDSEIGDILDVLTRGTGDNPLHVAAFGNDAELRLRRLRRFLSETAIALDWGPNMLVARGVNDEIAGVCNAMAPGECLPSPSRQLRMLPSLLSNRPHTAGRATRWLDSWEKHDPEERHWHLGPMAVDTHLQGKGVGSLLMRVFCARMDAAREDAYLETDKPQNVRFYERFGFEGVGEEEVLGVSNWFMLRRAEGRHG